MAFYTGDRMPEWQGDVFVGALAQEHVARLTLEGGKVVNEKRLFEGVARFRDVRQGPDGYLYLLTDEADGRLLRVVAAA
jgi:aldose sugar dehydrogenase